MPSRRWLHRGCALALSVSAATLAAPASPARADAATAGCAVTLLPLPADAEGGEVVGTDGRGTYVGDAFLRTSGSHGMLWNRDGVTDLGAGFLAAGIDRHGVVVGSVVDPVNLDVTHAAVLRDGVRSALPEPPGATSTLVTGMNARGDAVGVARIDPLGRRVPVTWPASTPGSVVVLATPAGTVDSFADGIDGKGRIAGTVVDSNSRVRGLVWRVDGTVDHELGALDPRDNVDVSAISRDRVVGLELTPDGSSEAVEWDAAGVPALLPDGRNSSPLAIDRHGLVGGAEFTDSQGNGRRGATLWWRGERFSLPNPDGTSGGSVSAVGHHKVLAGTVNGPFPRPALWDCARVLR